MPCSNLASVSVLGHAAPRTTLDTVATGTLHLRATSLVEVCSVSRSTSRAKRCTTSWAGWSRARHAATPGTGRGVTSVTLARPLIMPRGTRKRLPTRRIGCSMSELGTLEQQARRYRPRRNKVTDDVAEVIQHVLLRGVAFGHDGPVRGIDTRKRLQTVGGLLARYLASVETGLGQCQ